VILRNRYILKPTKTYLSSIYYCLLCILSKKTLKWRRIILTLSEKCCLWLIVDFYLQRTACSALISSHAVSAKFWPFYKQRHVNCSFNLLLWWFNRLLFFNYASFYTVYLPISCYFLLHNYRLGFALKASVVLRIQRNSLRT